MLGLLPPSDPPPPRRQGGPPHQHIDLLPAAIGERLAPPSHPLRGDLALLLRRTSHGEPSTPIFFSSKISFLADTHLTQPRPLISPEQVFELQDNGEAKLTVLGTDLESGQVPQHTVPPMTWFGSFPTKDMESYDGNSLLLAPRRDPERHYSLVGCTCAPAFQFEDFEMASYAGAASLASPQAEPFIRYLT